MVKEYFLAPNFSTGAPPKGPIYLGSILRNISEFEPLNQTVCTIPETQLYPVDQKTGFEVTLSHLRSTNLGLRAGALELLGVGANASIKWTRGRDTVLSCKRLDTLTFNPTEPYMIEAMKDPDVLSFIRSGRFRRSVYMVTGLKVASGASFTDMVKKMWIDRHGEVQFKAHNKHAVMQSAASSSHEQGYTLHWDDDLTVEEINDMFDTGEDGI
ncbi:uncharacterized protein NECHADRAFT_91693 [Fusarium vanettenii 77-13-4]|uniref:Uncharacterized protein n=1 Tax=Fusarium vanettenii (strain ATCC MYA-4622 / CBS 123669 / FGSC 9596 / NRRL 45880 / 77-13-4) TaxID=660122 RepID=C7YLF4_FUSV7|nr:uncharacterized protein NECHADRAFT_91693 [Fusarium vanettenii 77-13-4]EEU46777.1 hypothetical protein NECHADRAFT_91693 [Fusarium vanettenii 77-13-4]